MSALFTVETVEQALVVHCPAEINPDAAHELTKLFGQWLQVRVTHYVFNFEKTTSISHPGYRAFVMFRHSLRKKSGNLISFGLSKKILLQIQSLGLDGVFTAKATQAEALQLAGVTSKPTAKPAIDLEFIQPFLGAVKNTFELQASTPISFKKAVMKTRDQSYGAIDIAGVINVNCKAFHGVIALCFPSDVFLKICSTMFGTEYKEVTADIEDAAGELLNMIYGQVKSYLNDRKGYDIGMAIPTVVKGQQLQLFHAAKGISVILPFQCSFGDFYMEIAAETKGESHV